ncbi:MAG: DUF4440 domain-containing protein, partial [Planctomycetes bacterium]|nr:DUF4440 domain-containing protein [Planctomycetota bacterium]
MSDDLKEQLLDLTQQLLTCIAEADWETYQQLCDPTISAFEPEAHGHLIEGMEFHKFYFDQGGHLGTHKTTILSPHVRLLGENAAVVSYVRLVQSSASSGQAKSFRFEETRVWQRQDGQ